jgi:tetratricopeptide (TPR) repeat protein
MPITFTAFVQHISEMATLVLPHTMPYTIAKLPLALSLNQIVTSTMNKFFVCILLCMFIVTGRTPTAYADQNDPRLDQLFADLLTPLSTTAVQKIESQIWEYWLSFPNDQTIENTMAAAILMMERGQLKSAENIFGRIIEREPQFAEAWNKRATVRFLAGNHNGSAKDIAQVLQLEPRHFGALSGLGMIHMYNNDWQSALKTYELAFSIHPYLTNVETIINDLKTRLKGRAL